MIARFVEFTPEARHDVRMVLHESEARWGPEQADRYSTALDAVWARLQDYPEIGSTAPDLPGIRTYPVRSHRVYYVIEDDRVLILRVLHQRVRLSDAE